MGLCDKLDRLLFKSNKKGEIGEYSISNILSKHFPDCIIDDTTKIPHNGDI